MSIRATDRSEHPIERVQGADSSGGERGSGRVSRIGIIALMIYLLLFSIFLLIGFVELWPVALPAGTPSQISTPVTFLFWSSSISNEVRLIFIVAMAGALGSLVHALRSFSWYVGNRLLVASWVVLYITLPFVGMTLGLLFYFVIRGGFFSPQATVQETSPFGFAAVSALIGMFSPQAVLKLKQVAETLLAKPPSGKEALPEEPKQPNPPPPQPAVVNGQDSKLEPKIVQPTGSDFTAVAEEPAKA